MLKGLSDQQVGMLRLQFLIHECVIEKYAGQTSGGPANWKQIDNPSSPCRLIEKSGVAYQADRIIQSWDADIYLASDALLQDTGARYRLTVRIFKVDPATNEPVISRSKVFESVGVENVQDPSGADIFQRVKVKTAG